MKAPRRSKVEDHQKLRSPGPRRRLVTVTNRDVQCSGSCQANGMLERRCRNKVSMKKEGNQVCKGGAAKFYRI
jgi:hypothetical protein